ncbi:serine/threonine protein kinase [Stigmatella sp. ncwal1]|uniref:Serine/threonine protein kinase n=1 Tax=Stigmatella ashevillensis TaxID=2995309 RepID=A0ABT5DBB1_9BACT|nr:serine/threonine protein kinase [Stigmatella ashevillena]
MSVSCQTTGGVSLRPDGSPGPEECSEEALKTMRILRMRVGDSADVQLDANQIDAKPITLYDGPVESLLEGTLGTLEANTRLYGKVWTSGPQVVVRWHQAHPVDGDPVPICAVARFGGNELRKRPDSKPGTAVLGYSGASAFVVNSFR